MGTVAARCMPAMVLLATLAAPPARAQSSGVQKFQIRVPDPAYTGLPIWVYADLGSPLEVWYPFAEDPEYFGVNRLEVRHGKRLGISLCIRANRVCRGTGPPRTPGRLSFLSGRSGKE